MVMLINLYSLRGSYLLAILFLTAACAEKIAIERLSVNNVRLMAVTDIHASTLSGDCEEPTDSTSYRFDADFESMMLALADSLASGRLANDAEKLLFLADFSFALLPGEFLYRLNSAGRVAADTDTTWESLSLRDAYELANANQVALHCGHRLSFLSKLVAELMPRPYFGVAVAGKHHYPVFLADSASDLWLPIDPYDPFVMLDSEGEAIGVFGTLSGHSGTIWRTSRVFGPSRLLVSDSLLLNMNPDSRHWCGVRMLFDSIIQAIGKPVRMGLDVDDPIHLLGNKSFPYAVNEPLRQDTFDLRLYAYPLHSNYHGREARAYVPLSMIGSKQTVNAVNRFNKMTAVGRLQIRQAN
jgi:hypothetical protein